MAITSSTNTIGLLNLQKNGKHSNMDLPLFRSSHLKVRRFKRIFKCASQVNDISVEVVKPEIDFKDPDWKKHFQEDFDNRFRLPHLTDILDVKPRPTTFSLKSR